MKIKILYHIGEDIGHETIIKRGIILIKDTQIVIQSINEIIILDNLRYVKFHKLNGLGTMIKVLNNESIIYITVPRIYINIGTGFAIINFNKTKKLKEILELNVLI